MGLTGQRQLQGLALGLTPDLVPQGGVGGEGKRPQSGVMGAEFLGARVSSASCSVLRLFSQTRNATAPAPCRVSPFTDVGLGALGNVSEALRGGRSSVSTQIPFQLHRTAKPGNILSPLLVSLDFLGKREMPISEVEPRQGRWGSF